MYNLQPLSTAIDYIVTLQACQRGNRADLILPVGVDCSLGNMPIKEAIAQIFSSSPLKYVGVDCNLGNIMNLIQRLGPEYIEASGPKQPPRRLMMRFIVSPKRETSYRTLQAVSNTIHLFAVKIFRRRDDWNVVASTRAISAKVLGAICSCSWRRLYSVFS
jgi:hypothetical protein